MYKDSGLGPQTLVNESTMFIQGIRNLTNCFNAKYHPLSSEGLSVKIDHYHAIY